MSNAELVEIAFCVVCSIVSVRYKLDPKDNRSYSYRVVSPVAADNGTVYQKGFFGQLMGASENKAEGQ